jgi:hypothetical protein
VGRVPAAVGQWSRGTPERAVDPGPLNSAMRVEPVRLTSIRARRRSLSCHRLRAAAGNRHHRQCQRRRSPEGHLATLRDEGSSHHSATARLGHSFPSPTLRPNATDDLARAGRSALANAGPRTRRCSATRITSASCRQIAPTGEQLGSFPKRSPACADQRRREPRAPVEHPRGRASPTQPVWSRGAASPADPYVRARALMRT